MPHIRRTRFVALLTLVAAAASLCALAISTAPPAAALTVTGKTVAAGNNFTLVLGANGIAKGFGVNTFGQLANSTNNNTLNANPTPSGIGPSNLVAVAAGHTWGVGLDSFGRVWTFGNNQYGQLGRAANVGTGSPNPVSTLVDGINHVTAIAAGQDHTLALRSDGTVWGWGTNGIGELGNAIPVGTLTTTPKQIPGLSHVIAIAAGSGHSLVLLADGTVWGFGYNGLGQLGNGTNAGVFTSNTTPLKVEGIPPASGIAAGTNFSLVLAAEGTVWGFGDNFYGQIGSSVNVGNAVAVNATPQRAEGLTSIIAISAEGHHSLALQKDGGFVYAFGPNAWGQLGKAVNTTTNLPAKVAGLSGVTALAAGGDHSVVVRSDGGAAVFGRNSYGELGFAVNGANPSATISLNLSGLGQPPSFVPLVPARLLDTRPGSTTIDGDYAGDDTRTAGLLTLLRVAGRGGVPNDASAVVLNVTVTQAEGTGFITVYPCGSPEPNASSLNYTAGATIANAVIAKVGAT